MNAADILSIIGKSRLAEPARSFLIQLGPPSNVIPIAEYEVSEFPDHGIEIHVGNDEKIVSITLHGVANEEHVAYSGTTPCGISFDDTPQSAAKKLRTTSPPPVEQQGPHWRRFMFECFFLHLQHSDDDELIEMITIMSPELEPN